MPQQFEKRIEEGRRETVRGQSDVLFRPRLAERRLKSRTPHLR